MEVNVMNIEWTTLSSNISGGHQDPYNTYNDSDAEDNSTYILNITQELPIRWVASQDLLIF